MYFIHQCDKDLDFWVCEHDMVSDIAEKNLNHHIDHSLEGHLQLAGEVASNNPKRMLVVSVMLEFIVYFLVDFHHIFTSVPQPKHLLYHILELQGF